MNDVASHIAVVMPCFNGLPYIQQALQSVAAQTLPPLALFVVDDGSSDASADAVRDFAASHPALRIELIQQANAGEPAARNAGIQAALAAGAKWIAQLDNDDWWEPDKLALQFAVAKEAGDHCVLLHTGFVRHLPDGTTQPWDMTAAARRTGWCTRALLEPASIAHPSIMVRASALQEIAGYDPTFRQACDIDLYFRLSAIGTFAFVPQRLLHYRMHAKQMSASQIDQIPFHHRAVRKFFAAHPEMEKEIGKATIDAALAEHVALKLESLYWRRKLDEFRQLLRYAGEQGLENETINRWRRKARWPNALIRLKDRVSKPQTRRHEDTKNHEGRQET